MHKLSFGNWQALILMESLLFSFSSFYTVTLKEMKTSYGKEEASAS